MSNHVSLLSDLKSGRTCNLEAAVAIEQLERQVEELQRHNAMLVDALKIMIDNTEPDNDDSDCAHRHAKFVIAATSADTAAWLEKKHLEWLGKPSAQVNSDGALEPTLHGLFSLAPNMKLYALRTTNKGGET